MEDIMKKTVVAFDIGESYLKIAQQTKDGISVDFVQMPENLMNDGIIQMPHMFADAGFKLRTLIPQEISVGNIMKQGITDGRIEADKEYCIVNLGHRSTQIYVFKGDKQLVYRNIHVGGNAIDEVIAENENVDVFVARTRKNTNFNDVLDTDSVRETYARIAVEVRKVINFYRFNNRESMLENVYFTGGCSNITELCDTIAEINDLQAKPMTDILPKSVKRNTDMMGVFAIGVLLQ